jgi:hypothetical protein
LKCLGDDGGCGGHIEIHFGCVIGREGNCICSSRVGCPGEEMFLFNTEDECKSKMAYFITKKDLEVSESRIISATGQYIEILHLFIIYYRHFKSIFSQRH